MPPKHGKNALAALMRKIIIIADAQLRNGTHPI